jgi:protein-S-isoprenylcysteine O-methyltransferase Ste14
MTSVVIKLLVLFIFTCINLWLFIRIKPDKRTHGFYRSFAWELIVILVVLNMESWFSNPLSLNQIISWCLLIISIVLAIQGFNKLSTFGRPDPSRADQTLIGIEKTTELVTTGIFAAIRHPLYSSLMFLTWGASLKDPSLRGFVLAVTTSLFLYKTARVEEDENLVYFGEAYQDYKKNTKMFIPFIF